MKLKLILLVILIFPTSALPQGLPDFPFIVVSGSSEIEAAPDMVTISLSITEFNEDSDAALSVVSERGAELVSIVEKYNIAPNEIISYNLDKYIRRDRNSNYQNEAILGYEISQSFQITLNDISIYSELVNELLAMQNVGNINPVFDVSNREGLLRALVREAGADARLRANNLAEGLDVTIRNVFAINETGSSFGSFFAKFGLSNNYGGGLSMASEGQGGAMNMFVPKTITLNKRVDVVYRIRP